MPGWNDILVEIEKGNKEKTATVDAIRKKYLKKLSVERNRNVIAYYSGWLQHPAAPKALIDDNDKNAFMSAIHKLDRSLGLDLILHTPGGEIAATESLVDYLRQIFGLDIEVFIPQIAMSAGTMMACAAKKIYMGKQSNIGPIDPQFNGIPAGLVLDEFEKALLEIKSDPERIQVWQFILQKYNPTFILQCEEAIVWSEKIVSQWLETGMFLELDDKKRRQKSKKIVKELSDYQQTHVHGRHIGKNKAKEIGLIVEDLEQDNYLQDLVLTVHHTFMHTFNRHLCSKIVENHNGVAIVQTFNPPRPPQQ